MITVVLSATIGAPADRVWRALVDPDERTVWDERVLGEVTRSAPRQRAGLRAERTTARATGRVRALSGETHEPIRTTSWRFRLGGVQLVMSDALLTAERYQKLVSKISIGSMQFDQTLTLHPESDETGERTRLGMKLIANNSIAVIGDIVPRLDVQKIVIEYVDTTLRQVQKFCEAGD